MKTINMRAIDALNAGKITRSKYENLIRQYGLKEGRAYPVPVEVDE